MFGKTYRRKFGEMSHLFISYNNIIVSWLYILNDCVTVQLKNFTLAHPLLINRHSYKVIIVLSHSKYEEVILYMNTTTTLHYFCNDSLMIHTCKVLPLLFVEHVLLNEQEIRPSCVLQNLLPQILASNRKKKKISWQICQLQPMNSQSSQLSQSQNLH